MRYKIGAIVRFSDRYIDSLCGQEDDDLIEGESWARLMVVGSDKRGLVARYMFTSKTVNDDDAYIQFGAWHVGLDEENLEEVSLPDDEIILAGYYLGEGRRISRVVESF